MNVVSKRLEPQMPHQSDGTFLMDAGLETTLIFLDGFDLPYFASFPLLDTEDGRDSLERYFRSHLDVARQHGVGFILETPTWRASPDWAALLGFDLHALQRINRDAVDFVRKLAADPVYADVPIILSGCVGPRGDGYVVGAAMSVEQACAFHTPQIEALADGGVRMVTALTMTYPEEACGIAIAARNSGIEAAVSLTVETDGRLPNGQTLGDAIRQIDAVTSRAPAYFMVNCAHPEHFDHVLESDSDWINRIHGVRANASRMSHAELDEAEELDAGNPAELGSQYAALRAVIPNLNVMGGCCGTDHRHIGQIAHHACAQYAH